MHKYFLFFFFVLINLSSFAQKKGKPKLIIYGQGEAALASAIQASNSGVNTLWINPEGSFKSLLTEGSEIKKVQSYRNIDAGLWAEFLKQSINATTYSDSVFNRSKVHLNPQISINTFKRMIDSAANLSVLYNTTIKKIKKTGKKWRIELSNGKKYKVFAAVDASPQANLLPLIDSEEKLTNVNPDSSGLIPIDQLYASTAYRTSLLVRDQQQEMVVPTASLIKPYADNFFVLYGSEGILKGLKGTNDEAPTKLLYGQTLGAIASYCAFFEIKFDKINIRTLQGELLTYKGQLLPFHDVAFEDVHNPIIQRIALTGLLKGKIREADVEESELKFDADSHVSSKEIEPVMRNLYTRSQIWFADKSIDQLKLKDLLSLIKFIALKGDELDATVERGWTPKFKFAGTYDPECLLTRRQVAVLIDTYLQPFNIKIDKAGNFIY